MAATTGIIGSMIAFLFLLTTGLLIPLAAGVYVYRDAKRRKMNALLWTVVAIFVPGLIGFVIYLLVRGNYSDLCCPNCHTHVEKEFVNCPNCGTKLRPSCPKCGASIESAWKVCPFCGEALPMQTMVSEPIHGKDRSIGKIIAVVMIVPLVLIILFLAGSFAMVGGGSCGMSDYTIEEYMNAQTSAEAREEVQEWLDEIEEEGSIKKAYALQYDYSAHDRIGHDFLLYVPAAANNSVAFGMSDSLFGSVLHIEFADYSGEADRLYFVTSTTDKKNLKLKISVSEKKLPCEVEKVDFQLKTTIDDMQQDISALPVSIDVMELLPPEEDSVEENAAAAMTVGKKAHIDQIEQIEELYQAIENAPYLDIDDPVYESHSMNDGLSYWVSLNFVTGNDAAVYEERVEYTVWMEGAFCYIRNERGAIEGRSIRKTDPLPVAILASVVQS